MDQRWPSCWHVSASRNFDEGKGYYAPNSGLQTDLKEVVKTTKREEVDAFSSKIIRWPNENHAPQKQHACNDSSF